MKILPNYIRSRKDRRQGRHVRMGLGRQMLSLLLGAALAWGGLAGQVGASSTVSDDFSTNHGAHALNAAPVKDTTDTDGTSLGSGAKIGAGDSGGYNSDGGRTTYQAANTLAMGTANVASHAEGVFPLASGTVEYTATAPAFNVATNNFAMRFTTGVIQPGSTVELEFTVTANTSNDNRDLIYCGNTLLVGLGNAYPIYSTNLPATVTYNVSSCVSGRDLTTEDVIVSTNAWNIPNKTNFFYGSLTFSNIVLRVTPPSYTVTYRGNGHTGGDAPTDATPYYTNDPVTVLGNTGNLTKAGYTFGGWNTQSDGGGTTYQPGNTFSMGTANVTLYARWTDDIPPVSILESRAKRTHVGAAIHLPFTASDAGSGVASTALWVKIPGAGAFAASGLMQPGTSGAFDYTFAAGDGVYEFATKATDTDSNAEADPVAAEVSLIVNTEANSPFVATLAAADGVCTFPMTNDLDVVIAITGATPGGTITVSRTVPLGTPPAGLPAAHLIDESLSITGAGLGTGWTATLTWPFNPDNAAGLVPGYPLNRVFQFSGAVLTQTYTVTPGGPGGATLVIPGVTSFSDWFAGNLAATGIADWPRME